MKSLQKVYPVILAGGKGARLWPLSRQEYPKQILSLLNEDSLLVETVARVSDPEVFHAPIIICNNASKFIIAEQLRNKNISDIIVEPVGRSTAAAAAIGALYAYQHDPDALIFIMPSDHNISNTEGFIRAIREASNIAKNNYMITFGIVPDSVQTGYGYIRRGEKLTGQNIDAFTINKFVEKPDYQTAEEYIRSEKYLWNSGMFLLPASLYLAELEKFSPLIIKNCRLALDKATRDLQFLQLDLGCFQDSPTDSIDYAVMEKTSSAVVIPVDIGWSDIGTWDSVWKADKKDVDGNVCIGDVISNDCSGSYLRSDGPHLLACMNVDDMIVVTTRDATLVAPMNKSQDLKRLTNILIQENRKEFFDHPVVYRPWGSYCSLVIQKNFQVKQIRVNPGGALSLQSHKYRSEHWIVVQGIATVTCANNRFVLHANESTYIQAGQKHRLENLSDVELELIEVQSGSYLGEDDIIRYDDVYRRT